MNPLNQFASSPEGRFSSLTDWDETIGGLQMENLALKGALRDSLRLLQSCVGLFQSSGIPVPEEIAQFLGQSAPKIEWRVKKGLKPLSGGSSLQEEDDLGQ